MRHGQLESIQKRWLPRHPTVAQVWIQGKFRRPEEDVCQLDYHQPWGMPGVLTLDYILSGNQATYRTFSGACHLLDVIAEIRGTMTIVAHVSNATISDRLLSRLGWERHLENEPGRHWIKRFYDRYPASALSRFLRDENVGESVPVQVEGTRTCATVP